jgi:iron complex outermembrane recepter protein
MGWGRAVCPNFLRKLQTGLCTVALVASMPMALPAWAQSETRTYDIVAQSLGAALQHFARSAGVEILVPSELINGRAAPPLRGAYTLREGLDRLLAGSGLTYDMTGQNTIVIRRIGARRAAGVGDSRPTAAALEFGRAADPRAVEEIVVTAQKRNENVQTVPASVSVLSGRQLERLNATQLSDFAGYVPGFVVSGGGIPGAARLTLRGIASNTSATVATYIDDVPLGSSSSFGDRGSLSLDLFPYDIARVELLRGPQGTLYGANSMGGLLKYATVLPDLHETSLRVGGDLFGVKGAQDPGGGVRAALSTPLVDSELAVRVSYFRQETPGYIDNLATGEKGVNYGRQEGGRLMLLWEPSDRVSVRLSALQQMLTYDGGAAIAVSVPGLSPIGNGLSRSDVLPTPYRQRLGLYNATIGWKFDAFDFTSSSSYAHTRTTNSGGFADLLPILGILGNITDENLLKKYTQELRLASPTGTKFEWMLGGFFTNEDYNFHEVGTALTPGGTPVHMFDPFLDAAQPSTYREYAVFGNVTYRFNETFDIGAGLRWSRDEQSFAQTNVGFLFDPSNPADVTSVRTSAAESVVNYMVSGRYHFAPDSMLYARIASGYRPGGPNIAFPGAPSTFKSDHLTNYELGVKTEFLDRRALVDISLFYISWKDIQVVFTTPTSIPYFVNGGSAVSQGVEFTSAFSPIERLRLGLNVAFTDATISNTVPGLGAVKGDRIPNVPRWSGSATADYEIPLTEVLTANLNVGYRYTGDRYSRFSSNPRAINLGSYGAIDVAASVTDGQWTVRLYGKNLTDKRGYSSDLGSAGVGLQNLSIIQPRTIGVAMDLRF